MLISSKTVTLHPSRYAAACPDGRSRIDLVEKAHLHVRFIVSKSETQKRPQRASQTLNCGRHDVRGRWRRSVDDPHPKPLRPVPPDQSRAFCYAQADRPYREGPSRCVVCRQHARNAETAATHASKAPCDAIMLRSSSACRGWAFETRVAAVSAFLTC